jgi:hypothetical protein
MSGGTVAPQGSWFPRIHLHGNVFADPVPSNGSTRHKNKKEEAGRSIVRLEDYVTKSNICLYLLHYSCLVRNSMILFLLF